MEFEIIKSDLGDTIRRVRTPTGWLVVITSEVVHPGSDMKYGYDWRSSIAHVFDPFHLWKIKEDKR